MFFIFKKIFHKRLEEIKQHAVYYGCIKEQERNHQERRLIQDQEVLQFDGKFVICVSNEYDNISIGKASISFITASNQPVVTIRDYLTDEHLVIFGKTFLYNEQRLEALAKLTPNERCSLIYHTYTDAPFSKWSDVRILDLKEIKQILTEKGFYKDYKDSLVSKKV